MYWLSSGETIGQARCPTLQAHVHDLAPHRAPPGCARRAGPRPRASTRHRRSRRHHRVRVAARRRHDAGHRGRLRPTALDRVVDHDQSGPRWPRRAARRSSTGRRPGPPRRLYQAARMSPRGGNRGVASSGVISSTSSGQRCRASAMFVANRSSSHSRNADSQQPGHRIPGGAGAAGLERGHQRPVVLARAHRRARTSSGPPCSSTRATGSPHRRPSPARHRGGRRATTRAPDVTSSYASAVPTRPPPDDRRRRTRSAQSSRDVDGSGCHSRMRFAAGGACARCRRACSGRRRARGSRRTSRSP